MPLRESSLSTYAVWPSMGNAAENQREAPPVLPTASPCHNTPAAPSPPFPAIPFPCSCCDLFQLPFARPPHPSSLAACLPETSILLQKSVSSFLPTSPLLHWDGDFGSRAEWRKNGTRALQTLPPGGQDQGWSSNLLCGRMRSRAHAKRGAGATWE